MAVDIAAARRYLEQGRRKVCMIESHGLAVWIEVVTPDRAEQLLSGNVRNRKLKPHYVKAYAEEMASDRWRRNGATIVISRDGRLVDGQHRLHAIIESGCDVVCIMVRVTDDRAAFVTTDRGQRRTVVNTMEAAGHTFKHKRTLGLAASIIIAYDDKALSTLGDGLPRRTGNLDGHLRAKSPELVLNWIESHPDIHTHVSKSEAYGKELRTTGLTPSAIHALDYLFRRTSPDHVVDEFWSGVALGVGLEPGDPRYAFRRLLLNRKLSGVRHDTGVTLALAVTAWNNWIAGDRKSTYKPSYVKKVPRINPAGVVLAAE